MNIQVISGEADGLAASCVRAGLSILSGFYLAGLMARKTAYGAGLARREKVEARVISVGNITAGGSGKTPATIFFARKLSEEGDKVVVLSRGYGRSTPMNQPLAVSDGEKVFLSPRESGDEPYLMARKLRGIPVVVCGKRVLGARFAVEEFGAETILLDDGFQHIALERDEDIVTIDCANPFGYRRLLPRGLLREPLSALKRATCFLLTRADTHKHDDIVYKLKEVNPVADILRSRHQPIALTGLQDSRERNCDWLAGKRVLAVSSIGNPAAFEETLRGLGADVVDCIRYEDHHWYTAADLDTIGKRAGRLGVEAILSTEKDGVRLAQMPEVPESLLLLQIELQLIG